MERPGGELCSDGWRAYIVNIKSRKTAATQAGLYTDGPLFVYFLYGTVDKAYRKFLIILSSYQYPHIPSTSTTIIPPSSFLQSAVGCYHRIGCYTSQKNLLPVKVL